MITADQKQKILSFIKTCEFCVIATHSENGLSPESAVVALSETDNFEFVFGSFAGCRKNTNIAKNPNISIVVGWDNVHKVTVQIEGTAVLLEGEERERLSLIHVAKNEGSKKFLNDPRQQYFKVTPRWVRYSNFSLHPQEVWEAELGQK